MAVYSQVLIDGVDVADYLVSWEVEDNAGIGEIPSCEIVLVRTANTVTTLEPGTSITITRGDVTSTDYVVFKGKIANKAQQYPYIVVQGYNLLINLVQSSINKTYDINIDPEAGVASDIVLDMINTYTELEADSTTVVSTGSSITYEKFVCKRTDVYERILTIAETFDYNVYYDYDDDKVHFEPRGYTTNSNSFEAGTNTVGIPEWELDASELVNKVRIDGAETYVETTEEGQIDTTAGYTTTAVTLLNKPFSVKVFADASSPPTTLRTGGTIGSTSTFEYSVDVENQQIVWNTLEYTPTTGDYVEILYSYPVPVPIIRQNDTSIATYGVSETIKTFSDITSVEDAINRASVYLNAFSTPFVVCEVKNNDVGNDYRVGELVRIVDVYNDEDRELPITKIKKQYPFKPDEITLGDKEFTIAGYNAALLDRVKRIEEQFQQNQDLIIQVFDFERTFKPQRRYCALQTTSVAGTTLIWGHPTFGIWGTYNWGSSSLASFILGSSLYGVLGTSTLGSAFSAPVTIKLVQGNMTYDEYCYDDEFHNSTDSTATFDTSNKRIDFTSGQIWYSNPIDIGSTLTNATVTLGTVTGTVTIEISADSGVTWQTLSAGIRTTLTSSNGTSCILRITESGGSTARIEPTTDIYGQRTFPAIRCKMEQ